MRGYARSLCAVSGGVQITRSVAWDPMAISVGICDESAGLIGERGRTLAKAASSEVVERRLLGRYRDIHTTTLCALRHAGPIEQFKWLRVSSCLPAPRFNQNLQPNILLEQIAIYASLMGFQTISK